MTGSILTDILLIIISAFFGGFAARTFKLPPVIGYIISGVIFGIVGQSIFHSYSLLESFSQVGITLLLFTLGFEVSIDRLLKINKQIFFIGLLQVILSAVFTIPLLSLFGISFGASVLLAILFSFSSTAVVVKILEEKGLLSGFPGNNVFILLLLQDLLVIPIIFLIPVLFKGNFSAISIVDVAISSAKPIIILLTIIVASRLFLSRFLALVFRYPTHELTILATIFTASGSILLLTLSGLPISISAFFAGILISEQGKNLAPLSEIRPFRDIFLVLFFVMSGMLLDFNFFIANLFLILGIAFGVILIKFALTYVLLRVYHYSPSASVFVSTYMANVGEFAIVLGQIALSAHLLIRSEYNILLTVFILSLIFIPFMVGVVRNVTERLARFGLIGKILSEEAAAAGNIHTNQKFSKHVVICGHGRVGRHVRSMLDMANIPYVVVDFNKKVIDELIATSRYAIYGDPTDREILAASFIESATALVVAVPDSFSQKRIIDTALNINPNIIILCRSHTEDDRYDLINMGVNTIVMPELEAGLRIGEEVLDLFKVKEPNIASYVARARRENLL